MRLLKRRVRRLHDCLPPSGAVFSPTWTCPSCADVWRLIEHATYSEWVRDETG